MSKLILKYVDVLLVIVATTLLVFLVTYFIWEIGNLAANIGKVIGVAGERGESSTTRFNFEEIEKLNLKNLPQ